MSTDCPVCEGKLNGMISGSEISICQNCGRVDPDSTSGQEDSGDKRVGLHSPADNEDRSSVVGQNHPFEIKDSSDANLVKLLLLGDEAARRLSFCEEERLRVAELATSAWENQLLHGRSMDTIVGACLYTAARESERPRPISVVAEIVEVDEKAMSTSYRTLVSALNIAVPVTEPESYTYYLGERLGVTDDVADDVAKILSEDLDIAGNPAGIAAGVLYIVANSRDNDITLVEAGQAAGVSKETVWRKVSSLRELEISDRCLIRS
ncbi:hypothetical protein ACLI4R_17645 [Natrialbaceae archaeon A-chndr2]